MLHLYLIFPILRWYSDLGSLLWTEQDVTYNWICTKEWEKGWINHFHFHCIAQSCKSLMSYWHKPIGMLKFNALGCRAVDILMSWWLQCSWSSWSTSFWYDPKRLSKFKVNCLWNSNFYFIISTILPSWKMTLSVCTEINPRLIFRNFRFLWLTSFEAKLIPIAPWETLDVVMGDRDWSRRLTVLEGTPFCYLPLGLNNSLTCNRAS